MVSGYVAPEYVLLGQLTEKADVFSFGVVLLELISGRFNTRPDLPQHQTYLLEWVKALSLTCNLKPSLKVAVGKSPTYTWSFPKQMMACHVYHADNS